MVHIDVASSGDDGKPGMVRPPQAPAQLTKLIGCGWIDGLGGPPVVRRRSQRASTDQHRVGAGAQKAHDQVITRVGAADRRSGVLVLRPESDDSIHRGNEIGDEARCRQTEVTTVQPCERRGERIGGDSVGIDQHLELGSRLAGRGRRPRRRITGRK